MLTLNSNTILICQNPSLKSWPQTALVPSMSENIQYKFVIEMNFALMDKCGNKMASIDQGLVQLPPPMIRDGRRLGACLLAKYVIKV